MNVLCICVDTLRRDFLGAYADRPIDFEYAVDTPNLDRFAERAAIFENHYAGSLPTMPSRRELLTGTTEFLWRGWGPIEPHDTTLPERARAEGAVSQLITDNYHAFQVRDVRGYFEDYTGFEFIRGHELDAWRTAPHDPDEILLRQIDASDPRDPAFGRTHYARNVADFDEDDETDFFAPRVFAATAEWLAANRDWEQWLCLVDSFDVHEPFHCPEPYQSMYTDLDPADPDLPKWHQYGHVDDAYWTDRKLDFTRAQYAGKVTMLDRWFGRVLDTLDAEGLWNDTLVIVTTDHGHLLGEHGWIGKNHTPPYNVLTHLPLLVWKPDSPRMGERVDALTATVDLHATITDALGATEPAQRHSRSFLPVLTGDRGVHREWVLYGWWGRTVGVTDGRYQYLRPTDPDGPLYEYLATRPDTKQDADVGAWLPYTEYPVWRVTAEPSVQHEAPLLFDSATDPEQKDNLAGDGAPAERRLRDGLVTALQDLDAPKEQYRRLGLTPPESSP